MPIQVDGFSARIKPEPKDVEEEEEEGIGDVDLFALDKDNEVLTVNAKWLHHLQVSMACLSSAALFYLCSQSLMLLFAEVQSLLRWTCSHAYLDVNSCTAFPETPLCLLQERLLGEDGNPRKTKDNEDPFRMGLVLEWVYGTIVSTAEKARDSAKKPLGKLLSPPPFPVVEWTYGSIASCTVAGVLWTWLHRMATLRGLAKV